MIKKLFVMISFLIVVTGYSGKCESTIPGLLYNNTVLRGYDLFEVLDFLYSESEKDDVYLSKDMLDRINDTIKFQKK